MRCSGTPIPSRLLKEQGHREALAVCREVRPGLVSFRDFVLASVIGNTFDYGVKSHTVRDDFGAFFREEFARGLYIDDTDRILPLTPRVVYFSDNCGEIVFDRLLIEYLPQARIKGDPCRQGCTGAERCHHAGGSRARYRPVC